MPGGNPYQSISARRRPAFFAELREGVRVGRTVKPRSIVRAVVALLVLLAASPAAAQVYTERSYILPSGSVELTGTPARPTMVGKRQCRVEKP